MSFRSGLPEISRIISILLSHLWQSILLYDAGLGFRVFFLSLCLNTLPPAFLSALNPFICKRLPTIFDWKSQALFRKNIHFPVVFRKYLCNKTIWSWDGHTYPENLAAIINMECDHTSGDTDGLFLFLNICSGM